MAETPAALAVNGTPWLTLLCTPLDLEALAVGFLFTKGPTYTELTLPHAHPSLALDPQTFAVG